MVFDSVRTEPLVPLYYFAGYAAAVGDTAAFVLTSHPVEGGHFADDTVPAALDAITEYGRLGFGTPGSAPCPLVGDGPLLPGGMDGASEAPLGTDELTFVEMATASDSAYAAVYQELTAEYGLQVILGMVPDGLICRMNEARQSALAADSRVNLVTAAAIPGYTTSGGPGEPGFAERVWNAMLEESDPGTGGEAFTDSVVYADSAPPDGFFPPYPYPETQTSVYLLGDVGVSLLFMESDSTSECAHPGEPEDWTDAEMADSWGRINNGLVGFKALNPDAHVVWHMEPYPRLSTDVEPIRGSIYDNGWAEDAMDDLGVSGVNLTEKLRNFVNGRRSNFRPACEWWYAMYVIDDSCDPDHFFNLSPGIGGVAYFYGPSCRLLSWIGRADNESAGRARLMPAAFHETCHIFGAQDEYTGCTGCSEHYGYLNIRHGNCTACQPNCPSECAEPPLECQMDNGWLWPPVLCEFTRGQIGWLDSDGDGIDDPIDNSASDHFMRIGVEDSLGRGDYVDIYGEPGDHWVKRLPASDWSTDRGQLLWDGINWNGTTSPAYASYAWRRNGGDAHTASLVPDSHAPELTKLEVHAGPAPSYIDTLLIGFTDADTHGGRIRATATQVFPNPGIQQIVIPDSFYVETDSPGGEIAQPLHLDRATWTMTVRIWAVGDGLEVVSEVPFLVGSGVGESQSQEADLSVSASQPNPSPGWVAWNLQRKLGGTVNLRVVGVDGRSVRSWSERVVPRGTTRIFWDGRSDGGKRVSAGRYYLVVTDPSGAQVARAATIVR